MNGKYSLILSAVRCRTSGKLYVALYLFDGKCMVTRNAFSRVHWQNRLTTHDVERLGESIRSAES